ncbi:MAG: 50S ribosomal protein L24 [Actinomycetota bacterium]|nr:50S ribosomal protein L24 [Actinomycetota bacterium]
MAGLHVRKGDRVEVLSGKEKGKRGKVLRTAPKDRRVIIEGLNLIKRAVKPTKKNPQGGIITKEGSVHASNVMIVCQGCDEPGRVAHKVDDQGKSRRVCRQCGADIDKG